MMQYYKAKVRLGGSTMNEVEKILSAPEVLVLQFIHGVDAIVNVKPLKKETVNSYEEKARLKGLYDQALVKREQSIDTIFGPLGSVPTTLPDNMVEQFGIIDEDDLVAVARDVTNKEKKIKPSDQTPETQFQQDQIQRIIPAEEVDLSQLAG